MAEENQSADGAAGAEPAKNVDQIRDILFGGQMRDYERRFARVEEEMARELAAMREDVDKRLKALQALVAKEVENLSERLKADSREHKSALASLSKETDKGFTGVDTRITSLEENYDKQLRDMRQAHHEANEQSEEALRRVHAELVALIRREADQLSHGKVGRSDLAGLLTEVALRLNQEFDLPDGGG